MTLHEAIESILQETGIPMKSSEIADIVNKRKLYSRKDGLPVSASQITARVKNYKKIFSKEFDKIKLLKDDIVSLKLQKYKNKVYNILSEARAKGEVSEKLTSTKVLIEVLKDLEEDTSKSFSSDSVQEELPDPYGKKSISKQDKLEIAYKLFQWFLKSENQKPVVSDKLAAFFARLDWFQNGNHTIMTTSNYRTHYLLRIAYQNPKSQFKITYNQKSRSNEGNNDRQYIKSLIAKYSGQSGDNKATPLTTGIYIPPFRNFKKDLVEINKLLLDTSKEELSSLDKAIIVVPAGLLSGQSKEEVLFKKIIVEFGYLDSVTQFSTGMLENTNVNIGVLIFDFKKENDKVFFLDAPSDNSFSPAKAINEKLQTHDISRSILLENIRNNSFDLTPKRYVFDFKIGSLEPNNTLDKIENLILYRKRGKHISNRRSLYTGGEFKIIRTRDINDDSFYFKSSKTILGIDHDELKNIEKYLVKGGIVLSGFNKKLKANILPEDKTYIVGQDTYWIQLNNEKILDEYFIQELTKKYVRSQVEQNSKGSAIIRLNLKDFLKIQIKYPSLQKQKDLVLSKMRNAPKEKQEEANGSESDFINTLEHALKQPASSIGSDLASLRKFIYKKTEAGGALRLDESVVPLFASDTPEQVAIHTLSNTLKRMHRAVTDIDYILKQANSLATVRANPTIEYIESKPFFNNFIAENPDITIKVSGKAKILADRKQLRIIIQNLIQNAEQHGFKENINTPTIWIDVKNKKELDSIQISIKNNGRALPPEFTIEDFLARGNSTKKDVGSGFGGFLIGQILKNHDGEIELAEKAELTLTPHNVEFIITLPK